MHILLVLTLKKKFNFFSVYSHQKVDRVKYDKIILTWLMQSKVKSDDLAQRWAEVAYTKQLQCPFWVFHFVRPDIALAPSQRSAIVVAEFRTKKKPPVLHTLVLTTLDSNSN